MIGRHEIERSLKGEVDVALEHLDRIQSDVGEIARLNESLARLKNYKYQEDVIGKAIERIIENLRPLIVRLLKKEYKLGKKRINC